MEVNFGIAGNFSDLRIPIKYWVFSILFEISQ